MTNRKPPLSIEHCALCIVAVLAAANVLAVDFQGPGGDVADPANWGGALPDTSTAVSFGPTAVPQSGLTASANVSFGATTVSAGFSNGLLFNLAGLSYNGAALSVNSDATFQNGFFTNTTLSVASDKTLTLSGAAGDCVLRLTSASTPFASGTSGGALHVTDGAVFRPGGNGFSTRGSNTAMLFDKGATLDCLGMSKEYNIAFLYQSVHNVALVADNATMKFFTLNIGGKSSGTLGKVNNSLFSFRNGSTVTFSKVGGHDSRGVYLGSAGVNSVSNRFEIVDSSMSFSQGSFNMYGRHDMLVVSNSTFSGSIQTHADGLRNTLLFDRSAVANNKSITLNGVSNSLNVVLCSKFPSLTLNGSYNLASFASTNTSAVTLKGSDNVVRLEAGGYMTARPAVAGEGAKTFDVCGGEVYTTSMTIAGTNFSYVVRDGGRLTFGDGTSVNKNNFNFTPKASSNAVLRIQDGGEVAIRAMVNFTGNESYAYNWTNCPNCAIEFSGASPLMVFKTYSQNYEVLGLGTPTEEKLADPVVLRYVVPAEGWTNAPLRNIGSRRIWIYGNQPIEVAMENGKLPMSKMRVPLIYDKQNFNASANNGPRMTAQRMALLNENAILPERAKLVYDSGDKTIYCVLPSRGATIISVR